MVAGEGGVGRQRETVVMRRLELGFRWVYFNPGKNGVNEMPELRLREGPPAALSQRRAVNAGSPSCSNVKAGSYWTRSSTLRSSARSGGIRWPVGRSHVRVSGRENGRATRVEPDHIAGEYIRSIYRLNVTREDILWCACVRSATCPAIRKTTTTIRMGLSTTFEFEGTLANDGGR